MATSGVRVTVDRVAEKIAAIRLLEKSAVYVGIPEDKASRDEGTPIGNAGIGYVQEKGSAAKNIPPRPFLVPGVDKVRKQVAEELTAGAQAVIFKDRPDAAQTSYNRAGILAVNSVKATLTAGEGFAPLSERTLDARRRGGFKGTKPLIRTGQLRNSVTYVIRKK